MKYVVLLCDGMADYPLAELNNKTPMAAAKKPNIDRLASYGQMGLCKTVPDEMKPASDVANLSVLGYNPGESYTGRSPLEACSIGISLADDDVTLRCNVVTLSDEEDYNRKTMIDYSAGDISSSDAAEIIKTVQAHFGNDIFTFYSGVSYRHCLVWHGGTTCLGDMTPPHDISGRVIGEYLSSHKNAEALIDMMKRSYELLREHPVNKRRIAEGHRPANSIWLWGEGTKPNLVSFREKYNLNGSIISAVDLLRGIGVCTGMNTPVVEGATGYIDTNFEGKAMAAIKELESGQDFVYIHIEAPDECGHRRETANKVRSIEIIDELVLPILLENLPRFGEYKIMVLPDHPTPVSTATHARDPVPFMIYNSLCEMASGDSFVNFNEESAAASGLYFGNGPDLMKYFLNKS